jgi:hypothetical protein
MKKIYFFLILLALPFISKGQCAVQVQHTDELCNGLCTATAQAFPTGQAPYTYLWTPGNMTSPSVTNLCPGTYTVMVADANNCVATTTFNVIQPNQFLTSISSQNATCNGSCDGSAFIVVTGGTPPYTYSWAPNGATTPNVQGLCAGTYTCTVTDSNGCTTTATVTITQPPALILAVSSFPATCATCCNGYAVATANGGTPPYTYMWSPGNIFSPTAQSLCPGTYTCCVTDANGCATCTVTTVTFTTGIQDQPAIANLSVFPSPATDFVTVKETFGTLVSAVISVSNVLGETVYTKSITTSELNETINVAGFTSGVYFISVKTSSGTSIRRFVKE